MVIYFPLVAYYFLLYTNEWQIQFYNGLHYDAENNEIYIHNKTCKGPFIVIVLKPKM